MELYIHPEALSEAWRVPRDEADRDRLNALARIGVEYNLSTEATIAMVREVTDGYPFRLPITDSDIKYAIKYEDEHGHRGRSLLVTNFRMGPRASDGKSERQPVPLPAIIYQIKTNTGDFPRRVDNILFIDDPVHGLSDFARRGVNGLFGWLQSNGAVQWSSGSGMVTQSEVFAELERTATKYDAIEELPHQPPVDGVYYRGTTPPLGDGSHLKWLLDRFNPETTADYQLIKAAFMTAFWGGPVGRRPALVITSEDGRGAGKSTLVEMIARVAGGMMGFSNNEKIEVIKQRLLSPMGMTKRIALVDNIKSEGLSWAELEAEITAPMISGKRMYVGEGQRPNLLTWFLTLNGVSLATDMAQRSVIIKIKKGDYEGTWLEETIDYIDRHREAIIGDILAALQTETTPLEEKHSRWASWEREVLCRLKNPAELQRVILERQGEADCEVDEANIIETHFAQKLKCYGIDPLTAQVRIPVALVTEWFIAATGQTVRATGVVSRRLNQMIQERQIKRLCRDPSHTYGRCYIWTGEQANFTGTTISNDLIQGAHSYEMA